MLTQPLEGLILGHTNCFAFGDDVDDTLPHLHGCIGCDPCGHLQISNGNTVQQAGSDAESQADSKCCVDGHIKVSDQTGPNDTCEGRSHTNGHIECAGQQAVALTDADQTQRNCGVQQGDEILLGKKILGQAAEQSQHTNENDANDNVLAGIARHFNLFRG